MRVKPRAKLRALYLFLVTLALAVGSSTALAGARAIAVTNGMLAYTSLLSGAQLSSIAPDGSDRRWLGPPGVDAFEPVMSPDRTKIAFVAEHEISPGDIYVDETSEIYVMGVDGSGLTRITNDPGYDTEPAWSPDSRRLVFTTSRHESSELYVVDVESLALTRLTSNAHSDRNPAWSPDGRRIAFASDRDGDDEIHVMDAEGSNVRQLTRTPKIDDLYGDDFFPAWSPDGTKIAFTSDRDRDYEIFVMNVETRRVSQLTKNRRIDDSRPTWSPHGARLAFVSDADREGDAYVMRANGRGVRKVTAQWVEDSHDAPRRPSWAPDGRILFTGSPDTAVEVANLDGTGNEVLAPSPATDMQARWAPDGERLAFASNRDGDFEIYVLARRDGSLRQLTRNRVDDVFPTWAPGGRRIAFLRGSTNVDGDDSLFNADAQALQILSASGGRPRTIVSFDGDTVCCLDWSPDGTRIAFAEDSEVSVVAVAGGRVRTLNNPDQDGDGPSWSPDGRRIVFSGWPDKLLALPDGLYVVRASGGKANRLPGTDVLPLSPDWSPDGRLIAFLGLYADGGDLSWALHTIDASGGAPPARLLFFGVFPDWQPVK